MSLADSFRDFLSLVSGNPLLERLFFASGEFAVLAGIVWIAIRLARIQSARLIALLWIIVLAKPIVSLVIGSPLHVWQVEVVRVEEVVGAEEAVPRQTSLTLPPESAMSRPVVEVFEGNPGQGIDAAFASRADARFAPPSSPQFEMTTDPVGTNTSQTQTIDSFVAQEPAPVRWKAASTAITLWLAGVAWLAFRSALSRLTLRNLIRGASPAPAELLAHYSRLATEFGVMRRPRLKVTDELESPALVGSFVPTVLVPRWLTTEANAEKADWALRHELMHWKLLDPLAGLVREIAQALFYFHPAAWWAGRNWEVAAELACDRAIITDHGDSQDYAAQLYGMLVEIRGRRRIPVKSGLFATRTQIVQRIAALVRGPLTTKAHLSALAIVAVAAVSVAAFSVGGTFAERPTTTEPMVGADESAVASPENEGSKDAGEAPIDGDTVTVTGVVLTPEGKPAPGATVRAAAPLWEMMKPIVGEDFQSPMSETMSDANGRFTISFPTRPFGDVSRLDERWRQIWKKTTIAASLTGLGPAWVEYEEIPAGQSVTLRMVEDLPIRGRVIDLEGRPVAGTVVKIGELRGSKNEDLSDWLDGAKAGQLPWIVHSAAPRSVESRLVSTPAAVPTNLEGAFEIRGLGRERFVTLTFEGETVAHRAVSAVTRAMEPFQRFISSPPFEASESVFGTEFTFTVDPARTIEGVVRDAKTGDVLAGVSVESDKLVGYPYANHRVLKTTTDQAGRFRLVGMPKGKGNRLMLIPNDDMPYFMREVEVPDPVGLGPAEMEIGLHQGIWITGRVTDKSTGAPVPAVRMHYLPLRSNQYAQNMPEFDASGNVNGDQLRYQSRADGTYRLVGLPGRAIVGADSVMTEYRRGVGYKEIDAPKYESSNSFDTYRNPVTPGPKWPTMMRQINPGEEDKMVSLDFQLDPGRSVQIRVVDNKRHPLAGVTVEGLSWYTHTESTEHSVVSAKNFGPNETRTLTFHRKDLNVGRVLIIGPDEIRSGEVTVELQPCVTVVGRIFNEDGEPISGMAIRPDVLPSGDFNQHLPSAPTGVDGRFRVTLLPGCQYHLGGEGGGFQFVTIAREVSIEPGETRDLGTVTLGKDGKIISTKMEVEPAKSDAAETPKADARKESASAASREFEGNVVDQNGKPVEGATIWLVSPSQDNSNPATRGTVRKVASSDGQGRFSFRVDPRSGYPLDAPAWMEYEAKLLVKSDGNGFDWLPLAVFQKNPVPSERRDQIRQRIDDRLGAGRFDGRILTLPPEVGPVQGRLVDLEGRPLADVTVSVDNIVNLDFAMLTEAFDKSSRDLADRSMNLRSAPGGWISRHEWQALLPPVRTNANGEFSLTGLGRDQMAIVTFSGERVDAERLCILGRDMETKHLPHLPFYPNGHKDVFVGNRFTHAVGPAIPISGQVTEFKSGKPIAGATVFVERLFRKEGLNSASQLRLHTHHICTVTDEQGRYRLIGIPPGEAHVLNALPPKSEPWLIAEHEVSLNPNQVDATVNIQVFRGIWIEGRVTDRTTGEPISGRVDYLALRNNPNIPQKFGLQDTWEMGRFPIAESGRYRVPGLPGPGVLLVRSSGKTVYPLSVGVEKVDGYEPKNDYIPTTPRGLPLSNWNRIQQIEPAIDAESHTIDLTLSAGLSLVGHVTRPDGSPVPRFGVLGTLAKDSFFREVQGDKFTIYNYEPEEPRDLFFKSADNSLVGHLRVEGPAPADLMATLQPAVTARGRLIETETDEEAVRYNLHCESTQHGKFRVDNDITTDENGRFEIKGLLAGNVYRMNASNVQRFVNGKNGFTIDLTGAKPGDVVEVGEVTGKRAKSAMK